MAASGVWLVLVVALVVPSRRELVGGFLPIPIKPKNTKCTPAPPAAPQYQCKFETSKCNPCKDPKPSKPDGKYDAGRAVEALAEVGFGIMRSKFFNAATEAIGGLSGWGYVGAGIMDGIIGVKEAIQQKGAWNVYHLEEFVSSSSDYLVCEIKSIIGNFFDKYINDQDLCNYNIGLNAMADIWLSSCHSRQCLNLTDLPADQRGDCCSPSVQAGNDEDCQSWTDEQVATGQGMCRLQDENFKPGTGVCSTDRLCMSCMDFNKAIEMTQAQIEKYSQSPTNWGDALQGYTNVDAIVAQARGTMMMLAFYQELILLGAPGSLGNYQLFAKGAYQGMQSKIDRLMSTAPGIVSSFSCGLIGKLTAYIQSPPCISTVSNFCLVTGTGCKAQPSLKSMSGCTLEICNTDSTCYDCPSSSGCDQSTCYLQQDLPNMNCSYWTPIWQREQQRAIAEVQAQYVASLANVSRFLNILQNYSQEPLPSEVFGAYRKVGYRKPSCVADTADHDSIFVQCQHSQVPSGGLELPHSRFRP